MKWEPGRQGTGYRKMRLFQSKRTDAYLIDYPKGTSIPKHKDTVPGWDHWRLNIQLLGNGELEAFATLFKWGPLTFFRSDEEHEVKPCKGRRLVLSFGMVTPTPSEILDLRDRLQKLEEYSNRVIQHMGEFEVKTMTVDIEKLRTKVRECRQAEVADKATYVRGYRLYNMLEDETYLQMAGEALPELLKLLVDQKAVMSQTAECLKLMIAHLGDTDQDANHVWMVEQMRKALVSP